MQDSSEDSIDRACALFHALADRGRLRVAIELLESGERCACELQAMLGLSGATVSRHMGLLIASGIVESRKDGRWVHYRIAEGALAAGLREWLLSCAEHDAQRARDRENAKRALCGSAKEGC